jgi:hypothetical protein
MRTRLDNTICPSSRIRQMANSGTKCGKRLPFSEGHGGDAVRQASRDLAFLVADYHCTELSISAIRLLKMQRQCSIDRGVPAAPVTGHRKTAPHTIRRAYTALLLRTPPARVRSHEHIVHKHKAQQSPVPVGFRDIFDKGHRLAGDQLLVPCGGFRTKPLSSSYPRGVQDDVLHLVIRTVSENVGRMSINDLRHHPD